MKRHSFALVVCGAAIVGAFACVVACNGRVAGGGLGGGWPSDGNGHADGGGAASGAAGPYRITCSVYHRDLGAGVTEHARTPIVFMTDEPTEKSVELPDDAIPVRAKLEPASDAPTELVELTIAFPRSNLEQTFRLERDHMPPYELSGFHGFTGLNYVSTPGSSVDVQFVCEASPRDEERPKPLPGPGSVNEPPPQQPPPPPTPFRIRCETAVGEPPNASTDSFVLEGVSRRTVALGAHRAELHLQDDDYDGRSFVLRIPDVLQQLYQLDRTKPVTNTTRGPGGLTGKTIIRSSAADAGTGDANASDAGGASDRVVSIACSAATD